MRLRLTLAALLLLAPIARSSPEPESPEPRLILELTDGSRIVGTPSDQHLKFKTDYSDMELPWSAVSSLNLAQGNQTARLSLANHDRLNVQLDASELDLITSFGTVRIPLALTRLIRKGAQTKPAPEGLVLQYTFDADEGERVTDTSGADNHGKVHGASYTQEGKQGGAMRFRGDREGVVVGNPQNLRLQDLSILCWIKRGDPQKVTARHPADASFFGYGHSGYLFGIHPDGQLFLSKTHVGHVASACKVPDQEFHHVAVTKSGSKVVFYLDGTAYPADDYNPGFEFNTDAAVGFRSDDLSSSFIGVIDEIEVFKRPLSSEEIKASFDSRK